MLMMVGSCPNRLSRSTSPPNGVNPSWFDPDKQGERDPVYVVPYDSRLNHHGLVNRWSQFISQPELDRMDSSIGKRESDSESGAESSEDIGITTLVLGNIFLS